MEYTVATHHNLTEFNALVTMLIKKGWVLQGGVSVSMVESGRDKVYAQALVKSA